MASKSPENAMGFGGCGYKTVSGRFKWLNQDPLGDPSFGLLHRARKGHAIELTEGPNLYEFVRNNPINYYDPYGLSLSSWWNGLVNGWNQLFPDPSQAGSEEAYWGNMAGNDAQIENGADTPEGYMNDQRQLVQNALNPNEGFGFVGGEIGLGPVKVECMGFAGRSNGKPLFGALGAGGEGVMYGGEWSNQEGGQGVWLLDPGAGYGFYKSKSDAGGFAYGFYGFPGFELFFGVGGGYTQH